MTEQPHEPRRIASTRGPRRTTWYGYCSCGQGTTNSASVASVEAKLRRHAAGDDSGMSREARQKEEP